jgi:hypothetical protein
LEVVMFRGRGSGFHVPIFDSGDVELRFTDGEVCIYATPKGLTRLISVFSRLVDRSQTDHVHLVDYELLTASSLPGVIGVFPEEGDDAK